MKNPMKSLSILFVSDSDNRCETTKFLRHFTDSFFLAKRVKDALKIVQKEQIDIVIIDKSNALGFVQEVKKGNRNVSVVLIGEMDRELLYQAIKYGIDDFLKKPLEYKELYETLTKLQSKIFIDKMKAYNTFMLYQYKKAIDSSNIVSKTDINGIITYVNDEFCKISGFSKKELLGKNHNIVRHPDVPKEHFQKMWEHILSKKIWRGTVKNRAKDGSTFYVNTTIVPILDHKGEISEFVAIRYDVTESVKLQENLRKKERLMFQQSKLASLGEMLGNIAHQWRQPLMELGLLWYKMKKDPSKSEEIYKRGIAVLEKMSQTISDFQNFFHPHKEEEKFSVSEVIWQTLSIIEGSLKRCGIKIEVLFEEEIRIQGYKNELSQVLLNILANAKDALCQKRQKEKNIVVTFYQTNRMVAIEVADNAGGIDPNILEKIFEPYFTTKLAQKGTGLGLYMSKMIVEKSLKGELIAQNSDDGATFLIKIPKERV